MKTSNPTSVLYLSSCFTNQNSSVPDLLVISGYLPQFECAVQPLINCLALHQTVSLTEQSTGMWTELDSADESSHLPLMRMAVQA
jgi:hypothetical protein